MIILVSMVSMINIFIITRFMNKIISRYRLSYKHLSNHYIYLEIHSWIKYKRRAPLFFCVCVIHTESYDMCKQYYYNTYKSKSKIRGGARAKRRETDLTNSRAGVRSFEYGGGWVRTFLNHDPSTLNISRLARCSWWSWSWSLAAATCVMDDRECDDVSLRRVRFVAFARVRSFVSRVRFRLVAVAVAVAFHSFIHSLRRDAFSTAFFAGKARARARTNERTNERCVDRDGTRRRRLR